MFSKSVKSVGMGESLLSGVGIGAMCRLDAHMAGQGDFHNEMPCQQCCANLSDVSEWVNLFCLRLAVVHFAMTTFPICQMAAAVSENS